MNNTKEKKIKQLKMQLCKAQSTLNDIQLLKDNYMYLEKKLNKERVLLDDLKNKLNFIRESIPDFDKETYDKYIGYFQAEGDVERTQKAIEYLIQTIEIEKDKINKKMIKEAELNQQINELQSELNNLYETKED